MPSLDAMAELSSAPPAEGSPGGSVRPAPERLGLAASPTPTDLPPGQVVFEPNPGGVSEPGPTERADPSAIYDPFALAAALPHPSPVVAAADPALPTIQPRPTAVDPPAAVDGADAGDPTPPAIARTSEDHPPRGRKWGEVAGTAAAAAGIGTAAALAVGSAASHPNRGTALLTRRSRAVPSKADAPALCQFDARANQLIDFQLPDLAGQPVRFRDFDADYVLFDFWGTWCKPCTDSIPHLIDLQKKYGPSKLRIIGVACEDTPVDKRKAIVAAAAERLGINYSVLVASKDDGPVQAAFQVVNYPTMVLVNRTGKVVFRAVGATEANMYRLDKALAGKQKPTPLARW